MLQKKSNMLSSIPEFFKKLDQSFLMSSITAFYGANSKFNYIRIGLLGDMPGDDALDYLLASNSLCRWLLSLGIVLMSGLSCANPRP